MATRTTAGSPAGDAGRRWRPLHLGGTLLLLLGFAAAAWLVLLPRSERAFAPLAALLGHVFLLGLGAVMLWPAAPLPRGLVGLLLAASVASGVASAAGWGGSSLAGAWQLAHVATGLLALAGSLLAGTDWRRPAPGRIAVVMGLGLLAVLYGAGQAPRAEWQPPKYEPVAVFQFLTATSAEQVETSKADPNTPSLFPSALQVSGTMRNCASACHVAEREAWDQSAHRSGAESAAFMKTRAEFRQRRGETAVKWCDGCHEPRGLRAYYEENPTERRPVVNRQMAGMVEGVDCQHCHSAREVRGLYGSAALRVESGAGIHGDGIERAYWPSLHQRRYQEPLLREPELCAPCHRKGYNLPQNGYRWLPGPDDYGEWQASRYSGQSLYAAGEPERQTRPGCLSCHTAHGPSASKPDMLRLDAFMAEARPGSPVLPLETVLKRARPGSRWTLDVVAENAGVGHAFPTGMPDLQESWLEVRVWDRKGRPVLRSGDLTLDPALSRAHAYRLVALDRDGKQVTHGDLDRMTGVSEWRRILPGAADVARYAVTVPADGLGRVEVRLRRRRRPEFARWAGEAVRESELLAQASFPGQGAAPLGDRLRRYGAALAGVKDFPRALQALLTALSGNTGRQGETRLALGKLYLDQGDLLAAQEQFQRAASGDGGGGAGGASLTDRARAWEGAVQRRMGQPDRAAELLEPLSRRYPRDKQLRYELGHIHLARLRNRPAAEAFQAMLGLDPLDASAHFGLMVSLQRLNQPTEASREETLYRLLSPGETQSEAVEARPLHVHALEAG